MVFCCYAGLCGRLVRVTFLEGGQYRVEMWSGVEMLGLDRDIQCLDVLATAKPIGAATLR